VSEICRMALSAPALQAVQVRFISFSSEGHFTLEVESVFRPYRPSQCCAATEILEMAIPAHAPQSVRLRFKSVSKQRHFTLVDETTFRPLSPLALQLDD
jgi:xanthine dehydrogenase iron-sulfur cluster and FAD-binding subunit A